MAKQYFIYETLNGVKDLSVKKNSDGLMTLSGVFGVCGVRNNNQRVYETSNYSKMVTEMQGRIKNEGGIPGELEHPSNMNITLENISHKITDINIDENGVVTGTIALLNTPKGQIAQAIVEGGLPLFISSRATGAVDSKTGNVTLERISTYDLVGSPGFSQAKLKLNENQIAESINESAIYYITEKENLSENNEEDMDLKEILEKLESLEEQIQTLQEENESLREAIEEKENIDIKTLAEGIQRWIIEEYSPVLQNWVVEEFGPTVEGEINEDEIKEIVKDYVINEAAPKIESWIINEYSPEVENWAINEFAQGIQSWVINETAPEIDRWIKESIVPTIQAETEEKINESLQSTQASKFETIDKTLTLLEGLETAKPTYPTRVTRPVNESNEPLFIQMMPETARVKWEMSSAEVKESIQRRAKLYNLTNEGAIQRFWESINFETVKPATSIYEGLQNVMDEKERNIRARLMSFREKRLK